MDYYVHVCRVLEREREREEGREKRVHTNQ